MQHILATLCCSRAETPNYLLDVFTAMADHPTEEQFRDALHDKKFSDLSQEIYENSKLKKTQIDLLIQEVHGYIQGIEDIAIVGPVLKELFDVAVKNDDNLLKLATVIQRIMNKQLDIMDDTSLLTDEEKQELMDTLEETAADLQDKSDEMQMDKIRKRIES